MSVPLTDPTPNAGRRTQNAERRPPKRGWRTAVAIGLVVLAVGAAGEYIVDGAGGPLSVAVAVTLVILWAQKQVRTLQGGARRTMAYAEDAAAMPVLTSLLPGHLPHSSFSLAPAALLRMLNDVAFKGHAVAVECGCGVSTLLLAAKFRQMGAGHVYALEHDPVWAAYVRRLAAQHGVDGQITIIDAPLEDTTIGGQRLHWYASAAIGEVLALPRIDVLLVDGPPMHSGRLNRAGALPTFERQLHEHALVLLDDAYRPGERAVAQRWTRTMGYARTLWQTSRGQYAFNRGRR